MARPRALLVSWLFPPHGSIGAKRAYRFARHLPAQGWNATVLCGREPPAHLRDPSPWSVPEGVHVVADYDPAWLTTLANALEARARTSTSRLSTAPSLPRPLLARVRSAAWTLLHDLLPTETIAVHLPHAIESASRIVAREGPAVVWTTSYPYSAHLIGVALKRRFGIPFVADLRDPWTLNFVHDTKLAPARAVERRLEERVFVHADRVTVTTESLAEAYRRLYPAHAAKFVTIRNAFDPLPLPPRAPARRPVRLVHFGHVYAARTMGDVYEALARLRATRGLGPGDVVLENYGRLSDADRARIHALGLGEMVHALDPLPYDEGLRRLREAHLLLLPAWGTERGGLFLPGKLYDYLLAGAPILAIGDNPELGAILTRTGAGTLAAPGDVERIAARIAAAVDCEAPFAPDPREVAAFAAPHATARLAALFDAVTGLAR